MKRQDYFNFIEEKLSSLALGKPQVSTVKLLHDKGHIPYRAGYLSHHIHQYQVGGILDEV